MLSAHSIESNRVILSSNFNSIDDIRISIKYKYRPQFHVIDISRDTIVQDSKADTGDWTYNEQFPVYAIGRRTHYVLDTQNYDDTLVLNNVGEQVEESLYDIRLRPSLYGTGDPPSPVGLEDGVIYYRYIN